MSYTITALLDDLFTRSATDDGTSRAALMPTMGEGLPMKWRIEWEERAAIMEYDGGLTRARAEAEALADVLRQMHAAGDQIPGEAA